MKLRNPLLIKTAALLTAVAVKKLVDSLDLRLDHGPAGPHPVDPRDTRYIYVFWHEAVLIPTVFRAPAHVLTSQHADGEFLASAVGHMRFKSIRGSSTRGGSAALLNLIRASQKTHLVITPDGPRGPRRRVQPGAVFLASVTGLPIVPIGIGFRNAWRLRSWDKFAIPKPFSGVRAVLGAPLSVPAGIETKGILQYVNLLQQELDGVTAAAERWATGQRVARTFDVPLAKSA
jgi:lysophospholipid acyltransferase (LPLAT)-like uncharacterized protein